VVVYVRAMARAHAEDIAVRDCDGGWFPWSHRSEEGGCMYEVTVVFMWIIIFTLTWYVIVGLVR
jgi:hypothetical protein